MSGVVGKNSKSLTKQNVTESKLAQQGVTNLRMFHKATAGDTSISLGALSQPTELVGFAGNPSPSVVLSSILTQQKDNIRLVSSINQELMQNLTWIINSNSIIFQNGYVAEDGEIFEIRIDNRIVNGNTIVDARQLSVTGTLTAGTTTFNVGEAFEINANAGAQIGRIMVFKDGILQHRRVGNLSTGEGNYIEVPTVVNGKYGNTIDFVNSDDFDTSIQVVSVGLMAEKPTVSQMQQIETLGGQIDKMIPVVAELAGISQGTLQGAPNNIDLKTFGDKVLLLERILDISIPKTTPWATWTPTGSWIANTTYSGQKRQNGENMEYIIDISLTGGPTAAGLTVNLPAGDVINTSIGTANSYTNIGIASMQSGGNSYGGAFVGLQSTTSVSVWGLRASAASAHDYTPVTNTVPGTFANTDFVRLRFSVPIVGLTATQTIRQMLGL